MKVAVPVIVIGVVLDQITKIWAAAKLPLEPWSYLGDLFRLQFAKNTGAFLSLGADLSENARFWIFVVAVGGLIVAMTIYLFKSNALSSLEVWAFSLAISGGIGNLIDRIMLGYVRDFMNMGIGSLRTGIFNVADVAISSAAVLLVYFLFKGEGKPKSKAEV